MSTRSLVFLTIVAVLSLAAGVSITNIASRVSEEGMLGQVAAPLRAKTFTFTRALKLGDKGEDVRQLQILLNRDPATQIAKTGPGSPGKETTLFGGATRQAVIRFQNKYKKEVLAPAGLTQGTGIVGAASRIKLNTLGKALAAAGAPASAGQAGTNFSAYTFTRALKLGDKGEDVRQLQLILNQDPATRITASGPGSPGQETTSFGRLTHLAVIRFQTKYEQEVLAPSKLTQGTGVVGVATRTKLNALAKAAPLTGALTNASGAVISGAGSAGAAGGTAQAADSPTVVDTSASEDAGGQNPPANTPAASNTGDTSNTPRTPSTPYAGPTSWTAYSPFSAASYPSNNNSSVRLGMNMDFLVDWTDTWVFTDVFQNATSWTANAYNTVTGNETWAGGGTPILDAHSWPLELKTWKNDQGQLMRQRLFSGFLPAAAKYPLGIYYVEWKGTGTVTFGSSSSVTVVERGTDASGKHFAKLNYTNHTSGIWLRIDTMSSTDPIRDIHVWVPDYNGQSFVGQVWRPGSNFSPFHPLFLERLRPFKAIRYLNWTDTNLTTLVNWANRRHVDDAYQGTYGSNGIAYEYMIELSNELRADAWINVPHLVDDNFIRNTAVLVRDNLSPDLKVYVEWSNETWNAFPVNSWVKEQLAKPENAGLDWYQFVAKQNKRVFDIWSDVFRGQEHRVVRVVAGQASGGTWHTDKVLNYLNGQFDAISATGYINLWQYEPKFTNSTTVDDIFTAIWDRMPTTLGFWKDWKKLADTYSAKLGRKISLNAYEGGQHMVGNNKPYQSAYYDAQTDPRMYTAYQQLLHGFKDIGGDLFMHLSYVSRDSKYGSWGALKYQDQPISEAPKYKALVDYINGVNTSPTIAASAGAGGAISPSGSQVVHPGLSKQFTITPAAGYQVADVLVDGASQGKITSYTFSNITSNRTIEARFTSTTPTPVVPSAPASLTATANSSSRVTLAWTAVPTATSYIIERSTSGTWTTVATLGSTAVSHVDTSVSASTAYAYRIKAKNSAGESGPSQTANATTPSAPVIVDTPAVTPNTNVTPTTPTTPTTPPATSASTAGLVAHYPFEGNVTDASGNNNNGTLVNSPTFTTGKFGQAVMLNGTNSYVNIGTPSSLNISGPYSISLWLNTSGSASAQCALCRFTNSTNRSEITVDGSGTLYVTTSNGTAYTDAIKLGSIKNNIWYHVAAVYDGSNTKVYVNGVNIVTSAAISNATFTPSSLLIGARSNNTRYWNGSIDDARIYNRALSSDEISQLYTANQ